jgi:hypothetical protein
LLQCLLLRSGRILRVLRGGRRLRAARLCRCIGRRSRSIVDTLHPHGWCSASREANAKRYAHEETWFVHIILSSRR